MGIIFSSWITEKDGNLGNWDFTDELTCSEAEEYMTAPEVRASMQLTYEDGVTIVSAQAVNTTGTGRSAGYVNEIPGYQYHIGLNNSYNDSYVISVNGSTAAWAYNPWTGNSQSFPEIGRGTGNRQNCTGYFTTNIPIFATLEAAQAYTRANDTDAKTLIKNALNYKSGVVFNDDTNEFYVNEQYNHYTVENGIKSQPGQATYIRAERIIYNGTKVCFYRDTNNKFELTLTTGNDLVGSKYSNSSFQELLQVPYDEFEYGVLEYSTPFYSPYDSQLEVTDYDGFLATMWSTNIPIFSDYTKAQKYLNDEIDISDAENWKRISSDPAYKDIITNITEEPEVETDFGEVFTRMFFSQMYLCTVSVLNKISNDFFTYDPSASPSSIWDRIKKGIEQYGTNPMEVIQGLRFYPIDLSTVFTQTQDNTSIWIGAYEFDLEGPIAKRIIYPNGYVDLGTMTILRTFDDWRDFEPYTKLYVYLPYVGKHQLDLKKYYDKTVKIRYYIDLRTGSCCACLIANGVLLDWFDGIMGTEMPITLTDYSTYAQNQINIIMRNAGVGVAAEGVVGNLGVKALTAANNYNNNAEMIQEAARMNPLKSSLAAQNAGSYGTQAFVAAGAATGAMIGGVVVGTAMKTHFDLARNGIAGYTKTRPGSSSMLNQFLPQYPMFIFEIQEIDESKYLNELYGRPTNASGTIGEFSGYLEAEDVMLICPIATDNERQEIIDLVKSGIYI